jgi:hypothetical protein
MKWKDCPASSMQIMVDEKVKTKRQFYKNRYIPKGRPNEYCRASLVKVAIFWAAD